MLLEDAGLGADFGDGGIPVAALADGQLEGVGCKARRCSNGRQRRGDQRGRE